jgi:hypothetical protein
MAAQLVSPSGVNNKLMAKVPAGYAEDYSNECYIRGPFNVSLCCLCRSDSSCFSSATNRLTGSHPISSRVCNNAEALVSTTSPSSGSTPATGSKRSLVRCSSILGTSSRLTSTRILVVWSYFGCVSLEKKALSSECAYLWLPLTVLQLQEWPLAWKDQGG